MKQEIQKSEKSALNENDNILLHTEQERTIPRATLKALLHCCEVIKAFIKAQGKNPYSKKRIRN